MFKNYPLLFTVHILIVIALILAVRAEAEPQKTELKNFNLHLKKSFALPEPSTFSEKLTAYNEILDLSYSKKNNYGRQSFYLLAKSETQIEDNKVKAGQLPMVLKASVKDGKFRYDQVIALDFSRLNFPDIFSIEPTALALAPDTQAWVISSDYPAFFKVDLESGNGVDVALPGAEIPSLLLPVVKFFGGFSAAAVNPDGTLIVAMREVSKNLNNKEPQFIPLVRYDPEARKTYNLFYPVNFKDYKDAREIRIAGLQVLSNQELLVLESAIAENEDVITSRIYKYDYGFYQKTEITEALEFKKNLAEFKTIDLDNKQLTGLTFFGDSSTIAVAAATNSENERLQINLIDLDKPVIAMSLLQKFSLVIVLFIFAGFFYFIFKVAIVSKLKK